MIYSNIVSGNFISRPNRFIAIVEIDGVAETVHVKNTGRCKELFLPGAEVYLQRSDNPNRKTQFDIVAVKKGKEVINIDSQIPNKVFHEFVSDGRFIDGVTLIKPESAYKNSRFDFYIEANNQKIYAEIKGVTLEENGIAKFPDAPTERGIKHLNELSDAVRNGYLAYAVFIIQMKGIEHFEPNYKMHKAFADTLKAAQQSGVNVIAYDCIVSPESIELDNQIPIII